MGQLAAELVAIEEQEAPTDLEREKVLGGLRADSGSRLRPVAGREGIPSWFVGTWDKPILAILNVGYCEKEEARLLK